MTKKLSEMTLEELWQLFPIILTAPDPAWPEIYAAESAALSSLLPQATRISHIGSTAIHGIHAKPIVDILVELPAGADLPAVKNTLTTAGYICMNSSETRLSLNKGYTENGFAERVFHLHIRLPGDNDELYFRDYLNAHPAIAREYESLKLSLWKNFEHDRDGYTAAKSSFVKKHTLAAKIEYGSRY